MMRTSKTIKREHLERWARGHIRQQVVLRHEEQDTGRKRLYFFRTGRISALQDLLARIGASPEPEEYGGK